MRLKTLVISMLTLSFLAVGLGSTALAAKCKDVKTKITNNRAQEIKIYKAEYWDTEKEKWRTEDFGTWKIASKTTESKTKGLEYVKNQQVKMKVQWAYNTGGSQWSSKKWTSTSANQKCTGGQTYKFTIK